MPHALNFLSFYLCRSYSIIYFKGWHEFFSFLTLTLVLQVQSASNRAMEVAKHMYFYKNTLVYCKNVTKKDHKGLFFFLQLKRMPIGTIKGEGRGKEHKQTNRKTICFYTFQKGTK